MLCVGVSFLVKSDVQRVQFYWKYIHAGNYSNFSRRLMQHLASPPLHLLATWIWIANELQQVSWSQTLSSVFPLVFFRNFATVRICFSIYFQIIYNNKDVSLLHLSFLSLWVKWQIRSPKKKNLERNRIFLEIINRISLEQRSIL